MERKRQKGWDKGRTANEVNSNNNNKDKKNIQHKQRNAQSSSHCLMPSATEPWFASPWRAPTLRTPHDVTWYRIPHLFGQYGSDCVPSWLLVKINPVLAEPGTTSTLFIYYLLLCFPLLLRFFVYKLFNFLIDVLFYSKSNQEFPYLLYKQAAEPHRTP